MKDLIVHPTLFKTNVLLPLNFEQVPTPCNNQRFYHSVQVLPIFATSSINLANSINLIAANTNNPSLQEPFRGLPSVHRRKSDYLIQ
jgi:hypothetical protein